MVELLPRVGGLHHRTCGKQRLDSRRSSPFHWQSDSLHNRSARYLHTCQFGPGHRRIGASAVTFLKPEITASNPTLLTYVDLS